jgi:hypothetical protein
MTRQRSSYGVPVNRTTESGSKETMIMFTATPSFDSGRNRLSASR